MRYLHVVDKQCGVQAWSRLWFPFEVTDNAIHSGWSYNLPEDSSVWEMHIATPCDSLGSEVLMVGDIHGVYGGVHVPDGM